MSFGCTKKIHLPCVLFYCCRFFFFFKSFLWQKNNIFSSGRASGIFQMSANQEKCDIPVLWNHVLRLWFWYLDQTGIWQWKSQNKILTKLVLQWYGVSRIIVCYILTKFTLAFHSNFVVVQEQTRNVSQSWLWTSTGTKSNRGRNSSNGNSFIYR